MLGGFSGTLEISQPAPAIQWQKFPAAGGRVKVWAQARYQGDAAKAAQLANEITNRIWDQLNNLMDPEPASDAGLPNNGGDGALDIYLVRYGVDGETKSAVPTQLCHKARYILLDGSYPVVGPPRNTGLRTNAAHELMHAIEFAHPMRGGGCPAHWIGEASATWAENYVYSTDDSEHPRAPYYLDHPETAIDAFLLNNPRFAYGGYLLPYFQQQTGGGPGFMKTMWNNFATMSDLEGVNAVLKSGFDDAWRKFLVKNWNRVPEDAPDGYRQWDRVQAGAKPATGIQSVATPSQAVTIKMPFPGPNGLHSLAGYYRHFRFDRTVKSVVFLNLVGVFPYASVSAIEKIGGSWKPADDWTKKTERVWCRDLSGENLEELVLIFGNHDWRKRLPLQPIDPPSVTAFPTGCTAYVGTISADEVTGGDGVRIEAGSRATVRFEPDPDMVSPGHPTEYWRLASGTITWSGSVTGRCRGQGGGTIPVKLFGGADQNHMANLRIADDGSGMRYSGGVGPLPDAFAPYIKAVCPGTPTVTLHFPVLGAWWATDPNNDLIAAGTGTIKGSYTLPGSGGTHSVVWKWDLASAP